MARDRLRYGLRWKIGDGKCIKVWKDNWLTWVPGRKLNGNQEVLVVRDLIDEDRKWWDDRKIEAVFDEETANMIKALPLDNLNGLDSVVWNETPSGIFSVNSAYKMELKRCKNHNEGEGSAAEEDRKCRHILEMNIPDKVRHFLWRACMEGLPTRHNLCKRTILDNPLCIISGTEGETTTHILWDCSLAHRVWSLANKKLQKCQRSKEAFYLVAKNLSAELPKEDLENWAAISWSIWNARNPLIHEGIEPNPYNIVDKGKDLLHKFHHARERSQV